MRPLPPADAFFAYAETRRVPQTVVALAVADPSLTVPALISAIAARLDRLPWMRWRLVRRAGRGPGWGEQVPNLSAHVVAAELPAPGMAGAAAFAADVAGRRLPSDRPAWAMYILPEVAPGRVPLVIAVHHALADGPHLIALLAPLFSPVSASRPTAPALTASHPTAPALTVSRSEPRQRRRWWVARGILQLAADGMVRSGPYSRRSGPERRLAVASIPLRTIRAAGRAAGAQPTDVVLAALAGAVASTTATERRTLRFAVPVLARSGTADRAGNRTAALWITVPLDEKDPATRLRRIAATRARLARSARPAAALAVVDRVGGALPGPLHRLFVAAAYRGRFFHGIVSVMPGPRRRTRFGPAELVAVHPVLPLAPRVGLGVGALTWGDSLHLGVCTDAGNDPEALVKALVAEIAALDPDGTMASE